MYPLRTQIEMTTSQDRRVVANSCLSAVDTCGHSCHSHPRLQHTHACKGRAEEGTQPGRQAGKKLKAQPHDKDKHVCADDALGEAAEDALETQPRRAYV